MKRNEGATAIRGMVAALPAIGPAGCDGGRDKRAVGRNRVVVAVEHASAEQCPPGRRSREETPLAIAASDLKNGLQLPTPSCATG